MSKASEKARAGFGSTLAAGMQGRGGGAKLPSQVAEERAAQAAEDLTPEQRLRRLEQLIESSVEQYQNSVRQLQRKHRQELGELLVEIHDNPELIMAAGYKKFGHYITKRWGWDRSYAYRLMDLALVRRALAPLGAAVVDEVPEGQARELAPVVRYNGDEAARDLMQRVQTEAKADGKKVTAAVVKVRREHLNLGLPGELSPIGDSSDEDEVIEAEIVDDKAAELVNQEIKAAASAAEKALRQLDQVLQRGIAPYDQGEAATDLSRIRSAAVKLQRRADAVPGAATT